MGGRPDLSGQFRFVLGFAQTAEGLAQEASP